MKLRKRLNPVCNSAEPKTLTSVLYVVTNYDGNYLVIITEIWGMGSALIAPHEGAMKLTTIVPTLILHERPTVLYYIAM